MHQPVSAPEGSKWVLQCIADEVITIYYAAHLEFSPGGWLRVSKHNGITSNLNASDYISLIVSPVRYGPIDDDYVPG